jgi:hypothetical protein
MRLLPSLLLIAVPLATAAAGCTDSTTAAERTLFGRMKLRAVHFDVAGGAAQFNGDTHPLTEGKLAIAFCRWPSYTAALVGGSNADFMRTSYIAPGSQNFHPNLYATWAGFEIQKRWRDSSIFHPLVSLAIGQFATGYRYAFSETASSNWEDREEGAATATYFAPAVGVEMSLFKYMSGYMLVGARKVGALDTPALERGGFDGQYVTLGFAVGKLR